MFNHIRRHQKWLWILISAAVIISFVWYFNPNADYSDAAVGSSVVGTIGGKDITTAEYREAALETTLSLFLQYNQWPGEDEMTRQMRLVERQTPSRLLLLHKIDEMDIEASDAAVATWIATVFRDPQTRAFRKEVYDNFVKVTLAQRGITERQFLRFIRHQVAIEHLSNVAGSSGKLVTPQEAEALYREQNEEVEAQVVVFETTNYLAQVKMEPNALTQFYSNNAATYRKPERLQLNYVEFPLSNYYAQAEATLAGETNLNASIDELYASRGTNYYTETNGAPMAPEKAKAQIRDEARDGVARRFARNAAADFASKLLDIEPIKPENLPNLAAAEGVISKVSDPFSQYETPKNLEADLRNAFQLNQEQPFMEEPVLGPDAVYVVGLKNRIPSELPPLEAVRPQVMQDYQRSEAAKLARAAGQQFQRTATNAVVQKKTFEQAAQEAGYKVIPISAFAQTTPSTPELPDGTFTSVKNTAFALAPSEVSSFNMTGGGGYVLQVTRRLPVSDNKYRMEFPNFLTQLRRTRQNEAFSEWFRKQSELTPVRLRGEEEEAQEPATSAAR